MSTHLTDERESGYWPTVTASDYKKRGPNSKQQGLPNAVRSGYWPPDANMGDRGTQPNWKPKRKSGHPAQYTINQAVRDSKEIWPTPQVDDSKNSERNQKRRKTLTSKVWATPNSSPVTCSQSIEATLRLLNRNDRNREQGQLIESVVKNMSDDQLSDSDKKGVLNPDWVEWLMGWPIGWSSLEPMKELSFRDWSVDPADIDEIPRITTIKTNRVSRLKAIGNGQVPQVVFAMEQILNRR
jgi:DNA (cytosine-5)-methyltransferase 1